MDAVIINYLSKELQLLVWGDRNTFLFEDSFAEGEKVATRELVEFLHVLDKQNYAISNAYVMASWSKKTLASFKSQLLELIDETSKSGMILRKTFAQSPELTRYSSDEWLAVFAQYAVTYGWSHEYRNLYAKSAENVLLAYVSTISNDISDISKDNKKIFTITDYSGFKRVLRNIVESKVVLRKQQIRTLEATPAAILAEACSGATIIIKETLVKVMKLTAGQKVEKPLLKTSTDVLRFAVSALAINPIEGQLNKALLKTTKLHIPSAMRRVLLNNLELIASTKKDTQTGIQYLTEDMFIYEMFWRRLDKYLRYESAEKTRKKYPLYTAAIDLMYAGDRAWTFNGRYSIAKANLDYEKAIEIASERPGFLMRNLIEYLRMTKGVKLPVKSVSGQVGNNPFQNMLSAPANKGSAVIKTDASAFIKSGGFVAILKAKLNPKLAWQLLETLNDSSLNDEIFMREVQGQLIRYSTPIPAINETLTIAVREQIMDSLKTTLFEKNKNIGAVYIDEDSLNYKLQYSGRSSTEISYAGEFLSPGSELVMSDMIKARGIDNPVLRLGVMWRATKEKKQSIDLDHSVTMNTGEDVYYGSPEYSKQGKVLAVSSGDITSCGNHKSQFSVEFVDLNIGDLYASGVQSFFNSVINFTGRGVSLGSLETYFFFSFIDKTKRIIKNAKVSIDLSKADYAIRIDPDNEDNTGSYIGVQFDMVNDRVKAVCVPIKHSNGSYSNVRTSKKDFKQAIRNSGERLTIGYALKQVLPSEQVAGNAEDAALVISRKTRETLALDESIALLHPGRNMEQITALLF